MMGILLAEWMKTKRTMVRWITFFLPLFLAGCIIGYITLRGAGKDFPMTTFQIFFETWTIFVIPMGVGILAGYVVHQEELAGSFNAFLSVSFSRNKLYLAKYLPICITIMISTFLATIAFGIGITLIFPELSKMWLFFLIGAILAVIGTLPILAIHLWLSFAWGMGASIGVGICGLLMAAFIGGTGLGNSIWQFIPWALPVRLVKNLSPYLQFSADMTTPPPLVSSGWAVHQFFIGMTSVGCYLFIALLGGMVWFSKWEGRKYYE